MVSVVMATYNQAPFIGEALTSLRAQTLPASDVEVIVINDGSTDGTSEVLRSHEGWLRVLDRPHQGLVPSCNAGLQAASGRYLARLDSDDFADPEWLESLAEALESHPEACCAYPDRYELRDGRRTLVQTQEGNIYSLEACGTLFRSEALREAGGFRPFYWEEYDLYLRLKPAGAFLRVPRPLYTYRKHAGAMTQSASRRIEGWRELAREWGAEALRAAGRQPELEEALHLGARP